MSRRTDSATPHDGQWQALAEGRATESVGRGSVIYTPADRATSLFLVVSGQVGLSLQSHEGRQLTLRTVGAGQIFGHVAVADGESYDTHATASAPTHLVRIPAADIARAVEHTPQLGLALLEDLARHKATVSQRIDEVVFKSVPARLASLLLDMAQRHGDPHTAEVPRHSHRQLAEMINAYRETVTKVLNQFRDARLLEIERHTIMLLNLRRLEELAQG